MSNDLFRKEVIEHSRERLWGNVIIMQPLSFTLISIAITIVAALLVCLLLWGNYARKETVNGYLVPNTGLAKVYAKNAGIVSHLHVQEGQVVKSGERLISVSTHRATEDTSDIDADIIKELKRTESDLHKKILEEEELSRIESQKLRSRINGLNLEIKQLEQKLESTKARYEMSAKRIEGFERLKKKGHISENQLEQHYEQLLDNKLITDEAERMLTAQRNRLEEAKFDLAQVPAKLSIRLSDLRQRISDIAQKRLNIEGQRSFTLHAPADGRVTALQVYEGQTVKSNMPVLAILPEGAKFEAQLFVPTRAIGFIEPDQKTMIRYAAFPYQRYGLYEGAVAKISEVILRPDELPVPVTLSEPVYRVTVELNEQHVRAYGQTLPLQSGMLLEADIILENLTLIDWILDPLYSLKGRL
ncbi:HlyD family secretion protein [Pleionea sp. CnH1-48]|uniref:HlyD family secretion protein n=1 Tax=Pleionea sp. CnH1-48 TaxID=2954494 RepID=UPI002098627D|nr:HlyD family efflux transporter periplasmic adaptor subunit [Pleionea sp. CnH1-48]MCO7226647.1 HlyD family efflux transporter periplasmic adaptor subunit [Pleionea sp. CnH1-48]